MQSASPPSHPTSPTDSFLTSLSQVPTVSASPKEYITVITPTGERILYRRPSLKSIMQTKAPLSVGEVVSMTPAPTAVQGSSRVGGALQLATQPLSAQSLPQSREGSNFTPEYDMNALASFLAGTDSSSSSMFDLGDIAVNPTYPSPILGPVPSSSKDLSFPSADLAPSQHYPTPTDEDGPHPLSSLGKVSAVMGPTIQRSISTNSVPTKRSAPDTFDNSGDSGKMQRTLPTNMLLSTSTSSQPDSQSLASPTQSPRGRPLHSLANSRSEAPSQIRSAPPTPPQSGRSDPTNQQPTVPSTPVVTSSTASNALPDVDFFMKRVQDGKDSKNPAKVSCALVDSMIEVMGRVVNQTAPRPVPQWNLFNASKFGTAENKAIQRGRALLAKILLEEGLEGAQETYKSLQLMMFAELGERMCADLKDSEVLKGRGLRPGDLFQQP